MTFSKDVKYQSFLLLLILVVFWDVWTLRMAFLSGDHLRQHFPYAKFLQDQIRSFHLPWWTSLVQSGFPVLAEGQIGAFYLPNLFFLFLFPLKWAYNYEVLFHYGMAMVFCYGYIRSLKLSPVSATFATLIFLFGSANAGFFYNITSQRVTVWFPLSLWLADRLIERKSIRFAAWLAIVFATQIFAGYQQIAVYSIAFTTLYFLLRLPKDFGRPVGFYLAALLLAVMISSVQWVPMLRLVLRSSRILGIKELAYEGSVSPPALMTLFFPDWTGFWRGGFYVGTLGLFFALANYYGKNGSVEKTWCILFAVSLLLALGKFSPVYVLVVRVFKIYFFRVPAKFLFFSVFSMAVSAGFGLDFFLKGRQETSSFKKAWFTLFALFFAVVMAMAVGHFVATHCKDRVSGFLETYVRQAIYGKPLHLHSMEVYRVKINAYLKLFVSLSSFTKKETLISVFSFIAQMFIVAFYFYGAKPKRAGIVLIGLLALDLCYHVVRDIRTDLYPYPLVDLRSKLIQRIKEDEGLFRVHTLNADPLTEGVLPYLPNQNMLFHISDTGIYSPLAFYEYKQRLGDLGNVDDSLSVRAGSKDFLKNHKMILERLNTKYLVSSEKLDLTGWAPMESEEGIWLYRNESFLPRVFFLNDIKQSFSVNQAEPVKILDHQEGLYKLNTRGRSPGYIVVNEQNYPGWKAEVLGKTVEPVSLGPCLMAFPLLSGVDHLVIFYHERNKHLLFAISGGALLLALLCLRGEKI